MKDLCLDSAVEKQSLCTMVRVVTEHDHHSRSNTFQSHQKETCGNTEERSDRSDMMQIDHPSTRNEYSDSFCLVSYHKHVYQK